MIKKCFHKLWDWKLSSIYPTKVTDIWEERQKSFLHLEQRKLTQKGLVLYNRIRSQIPLVPKVVAKRWAELYLKKKQKPEREHTRLKKELLLSDPRMHWCLLEEEKKKNIFSVHSLLILELLVCEIFSWNVFLLGHKDCRLVHSIPNLPNSSVSWVYIFLCAEQVPVHKQASKEQYTNVGSYLFHPPLPALCSANMANTFLFGLCNQHRKILCVCFLPHTLFLSVWVTVIFSLMSTQEGMPSKRCAQMY